LWKMLGLVMKRRTSSKWKNGMEPRWFFRALDKLCIDLWKGRGCHLVAKFVPSDQAVEYFAAMAHMWEFGVHVIKTCSPETRMAMFGHRFYYNDCVPAKWAKLWTYRSHFLDFSLERTFRFSIFL
jgi:hypothetical protein